MTIYCAPELITEPVHNTVNEVLATSVDESGSQSVPASISRHMTAVFALCPYISITCKRYPWLVPRLVSSRALETDVAPVGVNELLAQLSTWGSSGPSELVATQDSVATDDQRLACLRQFRHLHMVSILWRDLVGLSTVDDTLLALSTLADACITQASRWAHESVEAVFGQALAPDGAPMQLLVLGMGKLGGRELNVSSDIDLIFVFEHNGDSTGPRSVDHSDYFRRVAQNITKYIGSISADGFVFRVDTRLRPFGESGPLVMSIDGLEQYYLTQGRDWERYAMIKVRPIVGDASAIAALDELLTPFIYRRYLDYNAIDALRSLKRKIDLNVRQKRLQDNVKLGVGGIREIEFIGQVFQLVRGGQQPRLRVRPIKQVLATLVEMNLMSQSDHTALCDAYDFLRKVENALQAMRDQQLHSLPDDEDDRSRLVCMAGYQSWDTFKTELDKHRDAVAQRFDGLFSDWAVDAQHASEADDATTPGVLAWAVLSSPDANEEDATAAISELGLLPGDEVITTLLGINRGGYYKRLTAQAQNRIDRIMPRLLDAVLLHSHPTETLLRLLALVRAIAGRSGYLQILVERPPALARLVNLYAHSAWVSTFVSGHPLVIDELLRESAVDGLPDHAGYQTLAEQEVSRLVELELDQQMDGMRQFHKARVLRIAAAEILDKLPLMKVSDQLTWLAESVLFAVTKLVEQPLHRRHGRPSCMVDKQLFFPEVGIVAYGKLGGLELGYGSDLDLVLLHDSRGDEQLTDGDKPLDNNVYFARLAQKIVQFMTTMTPAGVLYDIDLRLRPNGQSGVLVTALSAFENYQQNEAWTWEHQALVRARMITGSESLRQRFAAIRARVLGRQRERSALIDEVVSMRQRMRDNLAAARAGYMDIKQDAGGVADIEFMVQYIVLAHACEQPVLLDFTDNSRILEVAEISGLLDAQLCRQLQHNYITLRALVHARSLQLQKADEPIDDSLDALAQQNVQIWHTLFGTA